MEDELKKFLSDLDINLDEGSFLKDAPEPVDKEILRRYYKNSIEAEAKDWVEFLIRTYWDWHTAYKEIVQDSLGLINEHDRILHEVEFYIGLSDSELHAEFFHELSMEEQAMALRNGNNPIAPYLKELRAPVCARWKELKKRKHDIESTAVAIAIADSILTLSTRIPFPLALVSVFLFRKGLDRLCPSDQSQQEP